MIFIGLGANLPSATFGAPLRTLAAALERLDRDGVRVAQCSSWYESAPLPASTQPWFVNAVALLETALAPADLLALLLRVESALGRQRGERWAARTVDLDLLAYDEHTIGWSGTQATDGPLVLPHPRLHLRAFVLRPLAEVAPSWRHPVFGSTAADMLRDLPPGQTVRQLPEP